MAARSGSVACTKLLLEANADIHHKGPYSWNALHYAANCAYGADHTASEHVLNLLLRAGGNPKSKDVCGSGPLAWTAKCKNSLLTTVLLDCGADINCRDNEGDTPLYEALVAGADDVIQLLLQRGATYTVLASNGDSILHLATRSGSTRTLDVLLAANLTGFDPHSQNREGKTAIQMAQERSLKPDGFVEKTLELIMKIDARYVQLARIRRQNSHLPTPSADEGIGTTKAKAGMFSTLLDYLRTSIHDYADRVILSISLLWKLILKWLYQFCRVPDAIHPRLRRSPFLTLFLGWILGLATLWLIVSHKASSPTTSENIFDTGDGIGRREL